VRTVEHPSEMVEVEPLISDNQRKFMRGQLSADAYVRLGHEEAKLRAANELAGERSRLTRRLALLFSLLGWVVYSGTTIVYSVRDSTTVALAAGVFAVGFLASTAVLIAFHRRMHDVRKSLD
jgi:hypothetical protein